MSSYKKIKAKFYQTLKSPSLFTITSQLDYISSNFEAIESNDKFLNVFHIQNGELLIESQSQRRTKRTERSESICKEEDFLGCKRGVEI